MEKPAVTRYEVADPIRRRWSPRAFADRPVEPEKIGALLEAARWAASAFNEQPWRFLLATRDDEELYARALGCLVEANRAWAKAAPVLMLTAVSKQFAYNGKPNGTAHHDLGLAMGNLSVQATALGLVLHQMAGIDRDRVREEFNVPEDFDVATGVAIGYIGDSAALPDSVRDAELAPRARRPLSEQVFGTTWGSPSKLLDAED